MSSRDRLALRSSRSQACAAGGSSGIRPGSDLSGRESGAGRSAAHPRPCGHFGECHLALQIGLDPVDQRAHTLSLALLWHGPLDELRLSTFPMGRDHKTAGNAVNGLGAEIAADDMQAEVDPAALPAAVRIWPSST